MQLFTKSAQKATIFVDICLVITFEIHNKMFLVLFGMVVYRNAELRPFSCSCLSIFTYWTSTDRFTLKKSHIKSIFGTDLWYHSLHNSTRETGWVQIGIMAGRRDTQRPRTYSRYYWIRMCAVMQPLKCCQINQIQLNGRQDLNLFTIICLRRVRDEFLLWDWTSITLI